MGLGERESESEEGALLVKRYILRSGNRGGIKGEGCLEAWGWKFKLPWTMV